MKTAQPLDGNDLSTSQPVQGNSQRIAGQRLAAGIKQRQLRTADRTAGGFGMKSPVDRSPVFASAGRAEREAGQAGLRPIIRNAPADGVARAAMGAGGKGVAPAPVLRVANIGNAVRADASIRTNRGCDLATMAFQNGETTQTGGIDCLNLNQINPRQAGQFHRQANEKIRHIFAVDRNNDP